MAFFFRFKNGKEIVVLKANMTATYENQIATLKISETNDKSAGTYTCKASNKLGSVETSSELTIQGNNKRKKFLTFTLSFFTCIKKC